MNAAVFNGVRGKISIMINLGLFCPFQQPAKVIPENRCMADFAGANVRHLMDRHEGDNILIDELLLGIALPQTHVDFFALVDTVGCITGIGSGL